jgi:hypothetical protein
MIGTDFAGSAIARLRNTPLMESEPVRKTALKRPQLRKGMVWVRVDALTTGQSRPYHWTRECVDDGLSEITLAEAEQNPRLRPCKLCQSGGKGRSRLSRALGSEETPNAVYFAGAGFIDAAKVEASLYGRIGRLPKTRDRLEIIVRREILTSLEARGALDLSERDLESVAARILAVAADEKVRVTKVKVLTRLRELHTDSADESTSKDS